MAAERGADDAGGDGDAGWCAVEDGTFVASLGDVRERMTAAGAECSLRASRLHANRSGFVHGGVLATLLDRTMSLVAIRELSGGSPTASLTVNYLRPVVVGAEMVVRARAQRSGRTTCVVEGSLEADGVLVATATGVWIRRGGS